MQRGWEVSDRWDGLRWVGWSQIGGRSQMGGMGGMVSDGSKKGGRLAQKGLR